MVASQSGTHHRDAGLEQVERLTQAARGSFGSDGLHRGIVVGRLRVREPWSAEPASVASAPGVVACLVVATRDPVAYRPPRRPFDGGQGMGEDLRDRVAVVTGAGTGIGAAIAGALAAAGADLVLHYREHVTSVEVVAEVCRNLGRRVELVRADFAADPGTAVTVVDAAVERLGRIDILVNNAAVTTRLEPLETHSRAMFEETLAVNVTAPFLAIQAAARHMIAAGRGGRIISITSVHATQSAPDDAAYETSKGALTSLTSAAAIALGQHGITANCVAPGAIVVARYPEDWDEAWAVSRTPVGRNGRPEDIATMVCYLASDAASFISGEIIHVDGGLRRRMSLVRWARPGR